MNLNKREKVEQKLREAVANPEIHFQVVIRGEQPVLLVLFLLQVGKQNWALQESFPLRRYGYERIIETIGYEGLLRDIAGFVRNIPNLLPFSLKKTGAGRRAIENARQAAREAVRSGRKDGAEEEISETQEEKIPV